MQAIQQRAFTLIELIAVMTLVALLLGAAITQTGAFQSSLYATRSAARKTAGTMERARQRAALTGRLVRIEYDIDNQVAFLKEPRVLKEEEDPEDFNEEELLIPIGSVEYGNPGDQHSSRVWLESIQTYDGKVYESGVVPIDVRPIGASIGHVVRLRNLKPLDEESEYMSVELNPLTGLAYIYNEYRKVADPVKDDN